MTDQFRALCAELVDALDSGIPAGRIRMSPLADRARALLAEAEAEGPTDEELDRMERKYWKLGSSIEIEPEGIREVWDREETFDHRAFARAALARWGRPAAQPVAVSERLPGPVDCTTNPRTGQGQWCWGWVQHDPAPYSGRWRMIRREWLADEATHWLPAIALPTPEATNDLHS